jgi:molecular chaperone HscB
MNNPFSIFSLTHSFDLDPAELHRRFIKASSANHPDRFTDPDDQADAADASASINEAYRTLVNPESRANALLDLLGGPARENDSSLPAGFLVDIMDVRERLDEAVEANDRPTLAQLREWAKAAQAEHLKKIAALFRTAQQTGISDAARGEALRAVRLELNALRYFERMIEQMPAA